MTTFNNGDTVKAYEADAKVLHESDGVVFVKYDNTGEVGLVPVSQTRKVDSFEVGDVVEFRLHESLPAKIFYVYLGPDNWLRVRAGDKDDPSYVNLNHSGPARVSANIGYSRVKKQS